MTTDSYLQQAKDFLVSCNATFECVLIDNVPSEHTKMGRHDVYRCVIRRKKKYDDKLVIPRFTQSIVNSRGYDGQTQYLTNSRGRHDPTTPKKPTAYDVLTCLTKYDPGSAKNFMNEFGSSGDSLRDIKTYRAVRREWKRVSAFFSEVELNALREIN